MNNTISLSQAASLAMAAYDRPVITSYRLGLLVFRLVKDGHIGDRKLSVRTIDRRQYRDALAFLQQYGLLTPVRGVTSQTTFALSGRASVSAAEIACTVDPFAYVSHLSAMEMHGLTDRVSQTLYLSSPDAKAWRGFAVDRMRADLGPDLDGYLEAGFPVLQRIRMEKLLGQPLHVTHSLHPGAFRKSPDSEVRLATIGRTFLDMLREPALCGGIHHVLAIYREHAPRYLELIAAEVTQHGGAIDRVRAGYVLEEYCQLQHPAFEEWQKSAARGGSRRLVAANEYAPTYSERWALSLNAD